jgi:hypothetical protein
MTNFMSNYIGLGEISGSAKPCFQLSEKRKIQIKLVITGTIEWAHRSARMAARRSHFVAEEDQNGFAILVAGLFENLVPHILSSSQNNGNELLQFFLFWICRPRSFASYARSLLGKLLQQLSGIGPQEQGNDQNQNCPQATADGYSTAAEASTIFNVLALTTASPTHDLTLLELNINE